MKNLCMDFRRFFSKFSLLSFVILSLVSSSLQLFASEDANVEKLIVGVPKDRCPIFYKDRKTGEITGIGIDLMRIAAEKAGYNAVFRQIAEESMKDALDSDAYDVVMPLGSAITSASGRSSVVSENLFKTPFTLVSVSNRKLLPLNELHVGMLSSLAGVAETVRKLYPGLEIEFFETMSESVRALRKGKVDALLHNSYVWSNVLQKPSYSDLSVRPLTMFSMDFRVGAADTQKGRAVIERLDGGISGLTDIQRHAILLDYTSRRLYSFDFFDYIYSYGLFMLLGVLIAVGIMMLAIRQFRMFRREHEKKLHFLANHDDLTGALNLNGFREKVEELIRLNPGKQYFIAYSNIRNFKYLNDRFGMNAGNDLLKFWAQKSMEVLSDDDAVARVEADHIVVFHRILSGEQLFENIKKVSLAVRNFFADRDSEITVQMTSGVYALTSKDFQNVNVDKMLDFARLAEKQLRDNHKDGVGFCNSEQWENGKLAADLVNHFSVAIKSGEIHVWFQPQVDFSTGKITGAEALCRWNFQNRGWISPGKFVPILEDAGLIFDLDNFVWEEVCKTLHRWNEEGKRRYVSVNLSRADFSDEIDIPNIFRKLIQTYHISPDQLRIEITESAYVENSERIISTTEKLRRYGFRVEMDDFGSGYSSLNMLKEVYVDRIKLDLLFLTETGDHTKGRIIIKHVIKMAQVLGMELIAEGVEYNEQATFLNVLGCSEMQGYLFYKPMPLNEYEKLLDARG